LSLKITNRKEGNQPVDPLKRGGAKPLVYDGSKSYEDFYAEVYRQMFQILFAYGMQVCGNKSLTKDTIQELFSEFWKNQKTLKTVQSIKPYLLKCLRRKIIREIGKGKKLVVEGGFEFETSYEVKLMQDELDEENKKILQNALESLTKRQREAIYLRFYANLSYEDVANILKISTSSTYDLVYRSLASLKVVMTSS